MIKPIVLPEEMRQFSEEEFSSELYQVQRRDDETLRLMHIALMFRFGKSQLIFYHIKELQNVRESLPFLIKEYRDREKDFMLDNIKYFYGEAVLQRVKAAL